MDKPFAEEFKIQAVKQRLYRNKYLGVSTNSLYNQMKKYGSNSKHHQQITSRFDKYFMRLNVLDPEYPAPLFPI